VRYLLDTNICIALLKGEKALVQQMKKQTPTDFCLCSVVKAELLYGAHKSQYVSDNLAVLKQFFVQFQSLPFDDAAAEYYGNMRALLRVKGTPIGANDLLIASIAQAKGLTLLTRNQQEFAHISGLKLEAW